MSVGGSESFIEGNEAEGVDGGEGLLSPTGLIPTGWTTTRATTLLSATAHEDSLVNSTSNYTTFSNTTTTVLDVLLSDTTSSSLVNLTAGLDFGDYMMSGSEDSLDVNSTLLANQTNITQHNPTYYALNYQVIGSLFHIIIFLVGVLGNVMVVLVVARTKSMHSTTNCYLVSLAVADCLVLVSAIPNEVIGYFLLVNQWIWGRVGCALFVFFQYLGINVSSLSITAFTVERYIAICHPMKAQYVCTMERARRIIGAVWLFATCYCSPWLALTTTAPVHFKGRDDVETCTFSLSRDKYLAYYMADFAIFYVFPLLMSIIMYGLIARVLFVSDDIPKAPGGRSRANGAQQGKNCRKTGTSPRVQVVKMLAVVVTLFAVLWMPYRSLVVYNSLAQTKYLDFWYLMFCKTMVFINSAINPILYNAMSVKFRRAFKRLLTCGKRPDGYVPASQIADTMPMRDMSTTDTHAGGARSFLRRGTGTSGRRDTGTRTSSMSSRPPTAPGKGFMKRM